MRITKIDIPKIVESGDGLESIKMDRLGQLVVIAGKNGSGKTRILNKIFSILSSKPKKSQIENAKRQIEQFKNNLLSYNQTITQLKTQVSQVTNQTQIDQIKKNISEYQSAIEKINQQITNFESIINWKMIETSEISEKYESIHFVPKNLVLADCNAFPKNQIINYANKINSVGIENLHAGTLAKIQVVQDRSFNATHQYSQVPAEEKKNAIDDYEKLTYIVQVFLNTTIGRTINSEATLFGFPMGQANLSDGQKILLQFCLAIYSQETALKDLILILDEPENHLHPSVIIETLDRIQKCNSGGQIWIATHSIPLLAHFDPSLIWYVENNKISHAGKIPEKVLHSLLGDDNEIAKLQDFISLPAQYATSRYAFECLVETPAVMTGSDDPQSYQVRAELLKLSKDGMLRVLDYGAGQGRFISNIFDLEQTDHTNLINKLDYIAYDKFNTEKEHCEYSIKKVFGKSDNRYFNDTAKLLSVYDKKSFNVIIMCNVLHEIDPKDWLKLFSTDGFIPSLLADNGFLLLVEDYQMPIGEKAYQKGFLILDTPQLKDLFKITEKDTDFTVSDKKGDGRLKAHQIPKRCLIQIDESSRLEALKSLSIIAREKILQIREQEKNYQNGKLHGFWTQQFANSQLNIAELTTNK
ncbi:MAG: AAA family ATPase [Smithella sp.]